MVLNWETRRRRPHFPCRALRKGCFRRLNWRSSAGGGKINAVIYGAGNIGRGFIGQLFAQSGYALTFIDIDETLTGALNREGRYPLRFLTEDAVEEIWVEGVRAINGHSREDAARAIAGADIMATAVGVRALPLIAPIIAAGFHQRFTINSKPLTIIMCENLIGAGAELGRHIKAHLSGEDVRLFDECAGLAAASIGRMVPLQTPEMRDGNPLRICVEAYDSLPVDKAAFKGDIPPLAGIHPVDCFDFYMRRKLFVHNMGHAVCAYLGMFRGDTCIFETVRDGGILFIAHNAMLESALALSAAYGVPMTDLHCHIRDLLRRFSNKALRDTCARVGGDTARKLGNNDRLIGAIRFCIGENVNPVFISAGAAAAVYCYLRENGLPQNRAAAAAVLGEVSGLAENAAGTGQILSFYSLLAPAAQGENSDTIIAHIITAALKAGA